MRRPAKARKKSARYVEVSLIFHFQLPEDMEMVEIEN